MIGHVSDGGNLVQDATADGLSFINNITPSTSSSSSSPPPIDYSNNINNSNGSTSIQQQQQQQQKELEEEQQKQLEHQRKGLPWINKAASPNVTALLGKTVYLNCRVASLADKTVSF